MRLYILYQLLYLHVQSIVITLLHAYLSCRDDNEVNMEHEGEQNQAIYAHTI